MPAHSSAAYLRRWRREHPDRVREHSRAARQRLDRQHLRARWVVADAVRRGRLVPPSHCTDCGDEPGVDTLGRRRIEAHHAEYERPLDVEWLCRDCHLGRHRRAAA